MTRVVCYSVRTNFRLMWKQRVLDEGGLDCIRLCRTLISEKLGCIKTLSMLAYPYRGDNKCTVYDNHIVILCRRSNIIFRCRCSRRRPSNQSILIEHSSFKDVIRGTSDPYLVRRTTYASNAIIYLYH
jgi:hypothetical protein